MAEIRYNLTEFEALATSLAIQGFQNSFDGINLDVTTYYKLLVTTFL